MHRFINGVSEQNAPSRPGVYAVAFGDDPRKYVGSSRNLKQRLQAHRWLMKGGRGQNIWCSELLGKWGFDNAYFEVLELCDEAVLEAREDYWSSQNERLNKNPVSRKSIASQAEKMRAIHAKNREESPLIRQRNVQRVEAKATSRQRKIERAERACFTLENTIKNYACAIKKTEARLKEARAKLQSLRPG